ncbi:MULTISPECIES: PPE family protein [unclassified Mycobacterium]|uniref:PPE family protein n=1 Tax=unclassified Mycobacterium TaxID=2642494 RepID=UPI002741126D|nr:MULTISPECIES: PPE family protein [unclassified Mycobacterium]MDP7701898.1 PPE family protein [Mycobacterium sp. TY815]MDP7724733.1 PPE family protein [Mycobacterium sp. TY814]
MTGFGGWMAAPPEVHSALLSSGPGPGALLAAASAWSALSTEYASAADELVAVLAGVQGAAWAGPSAEQYTTAHVPYLAWLMRASQISADNAAREEGIAAAYLSALAAMPTLAELAANHAVHGALVATNFFGINTIPIALNEADYARMWTQAATTMSGYEAASDAALAATPAAEPAPQITRSDAEANPASSTSPWQDFLQQIEQFLQNPLQAYQDFMSNPQLNPFTQFENLVNNPQLDAILQQFGIGNDTIAHDPLVDNALDDFVANILRNFGYDWSPADGTLNGLEYDYYTDPTVAAFWVARTLELGEDFQQFFVYLQTNPVLAVQYLVSLELFDFPTHLAEVFTLTSQPLALAAAFPLAAAPLASVGGLAGLAGLAALPQPVMAPAVVPIGPPPPLPVVGLSSVTAPAAAPASVPAPTPNSTAGPPPPSPSPPAPAGAGGAGFTPPYAAAPPGIGFGSGLGAKASSGAKRQASEPDSAAQAAAAAAREQARARRRRAAKGRGFGDEFLDMDVDVDPQWDAPPSTQASERGAQTMGFAGTLSDGRVDSAAGLATLAADEFGDGPTMPLLPGSWRPLSDSQ